MSLDAKLKRKLAQLLAAVDERDTRGPRLVDDAQRLYARIRKLMAMNLIAEPDADALEVTCYALQLPMKQARPPTYGKLGRTNIRDRAEQAAELLVTFAAEQMDESLLDRTTRLLHEVPHRHPVVEDARLLADAISLDDFGATGLIVQTIAHARQGDGINQLLEGYQKRDEYGYWEARLKDGFHFEPIRQIAKRRLARARQIVGLLAEELQEDADG